MLLLTIMIDVKKPLRLGHEKPRNTRIEMRLRLDRFLQNRYMAREEDGAPERFKRRGSEDDSPQSSAACC
jgi:hypothetical protein